MLPITESNHEVVRAPISVLQLERSRDGRGTLTVDPHLPQKRQKGRVAKTFRVLFNSNNTNLCIFTPLAYFRVGLECCIHFVVLSYRTL